MLELKIQKEVLERNFVLRALEAAAEYHGLELRYAPNEVPNDARHIELHQGEESGLILRLDLSSNYPARIPVAIFNNEDVEESYITEIVDHLQGELDRYAGLVPAAFPDHLKHYGHLSLGQMIYHFARDDADAVVLAQTIAAMFDQVYGNGSEQYLGTLPKVSFIAADREEFLAAAAVLANAAECDKGKRNWAHVFSEIYQRIEQGELTSVLQIIREYRPDRETQVQAA